MGEEVSIRKETRKDDGGALGQAKGLWQQVKQYLYEVKTETKRVTWPGKQEIYGTTVMVILTTFLFGLFFYVCDMAFSRTMTGLLNYLRHHI